MITFLSHMKLNFVRKRRPAAPAQQLPIVKEDSGLDITILAGCKERCPVLNTLINGGSQPDLRRRIIGLGCNYLLL